MLEEILRLLHPITPFITEELWQKVAMVAGKLSPGQETSISIQPYPIRRSDLVDARAQEAFDTLKSRVEAIRALRSEMQLSPAERVPLIAQGPNDSLTEQAPYLAFLAKLDRKSVV